MKHFCSFSEAIRAGIEIRPRQCFSTFFEGNDASCVVGAALEATLGRPLNDEDYANWDTAMRPVANFYLYMCENTDAPCGCREIDSACVSYITGRPWLKASLYNIAVHLNNKHRWTREAIADWLESEEEKLGFVTLVEGESSRSQTEVSDVVMVH